MKGGYLNITSDQKSLSFFKFLQKKVSTLDKRNFVNLLNEAKGFLDDYCNLQPLKLYKNVH